MVPMIPGLLHCLCSIPCLTVFPFLSSREHFPFWIITFPPVSSNLLADNRQLGASGIYNMCCNLWVTNLLLTLNFMEIMPYPSVIAGFLISRKGVAKVAMNSVKAFRLLVMWEVVLESRYQLDLEFPSILAVAMYVRLYRLNFLLQPNLIYLYSALFSLMVFSLPCLHLLPNNPWQYVPSSYNYNISFHHNHPSPSCVYLCPLLVMLSQLCFLINLYTFDLHQEEWQ